jgi:SH3-like domain-containing protein
MRRPPGPRRPPRSPARPGRLSRLLAAALAAVLASVLASAAALPLASDAIAAPSKRHVPRFVSLRAGEVNVRAGPGTKYPIKWVFKRRGLPVEIIEEFEHWRRIRDFEGEIGWVHQQTLSGRRGVMVMGKVRVMRNRPSTKARAVARVAPKVVGRLLECAGAWCRIDVAGHRGWLRRKEIWGVYPKEKVE